RGNKGSIRDHSASLNHVNCLPIIASTKAETLNQQQSLSATLLSTDPSAHRHSVSRSRESGNPAS
ncbi:MAG TPA: hypothetical protein VGO55_13060, partial [Allosphingosinicella sp.]|nr:hypothetical protein [Allosphingosinicella sp.]